MIATPVISHRDPQNGPRPINLNRDVRQVLQLMELAFGPILGSHGQRFSGERLSLNYEPPLLLRLNMMTSGFVPGFVWDEAGQIVGNVSLIESQVPDRYLIANVAVHPDHRRRGIARSLMEKTIDHVEGRGGQEVLLQVETGNQAAIDLYRSLDFSTVGANCHWESRTNRVRPLTLTGRHKPEIRPLSGRQWREAHQLDVGSVEPDLTWPAPPRPDLYKTGWWRAIGDFVNGRRAESWVVTESGPDEPQTPRLTGLVSIHSTWGQPHKVTLRVAHHRRGELERPLLAKTLRRLSYLRGGTIQMIHPADDQMVEPLLNEANFQVRRKLTVMRLTLIQ
jgi:ribosomal protein S18 acetylase RimI-like enzyme